MECLSLMVRKSHCEIINITYRTLWKQSKMKKTISFEIFQDMNAIAVLLYCDSRLYVDDDLFITKDFLLQVASRRKCLIFKRSSKMMNRMSSAKFSFVETFLSFELQQERKAGSASLLLLNLVRFISANFFSSLRRDPTQCRLLIVLLQASLVKCNFILSSYNSNVNDVFTQKSSINFSRRLREIYDLFEMLFFSSEEHKMNLQVRMKFYSKSLTRCVSLEEAAKSSSGWRQVKARREKQEDVEGKNLLKIYWVYDLCWWLFSCYQLNAETSWRLNKLTASWWDDLNEHK